MVMGESKPSRPSEGNELKITIDSTKGKASKPKKYRSKKPKKKKSSESEIEADFQG